MLDFVRTIKNSFAILACTRNSIKSYAVKWFEMSRPLHWLVSAGSHDHIFQVWTRWPVAAKKWIGEWQTREEKNARDIGMFSSFISVCRRRGNSQLHVVLIIPRDGWLWSKHSTMLMSFPTPESISPCQINIPHYHAYFKNVTNVTHVQ
jgi:hypothetical protein